MTGTVTAWSAQGSNGRLPRVESAAKATLRRELLAARAALPAAELARRADALLQVATGCPPVTAARSCAAFVSVGAEPGTGPLLGRLLAAGVRVLLPVLGPNRSLDWALDDGPDRLCRGRYGLLEPTGPRLGPAAVSLADLVLVPALAVDRAGRRLGRGGGYYDRALSLAAPRATVLAVVYDEEMLDEVPVEPHDRAVAGALTPTCWYPLS